MAKVRDSPSEASFRTRSFPSERALWASFHAGVVVERDYNGPGKKGKGRKYSLVGPERKKGVNSALRGWKIERGQRAEECRDEGALTYRARERQRENHLLKVA